MFFRQPAPILIYTQYTVLWRVLFYLCEREYSLHTGCLRACERICHLNYCVFVMLVDLSVCVSVLCLSNKSCFKDESNQINVISLCCSGDVDSIHCLFRSRMILLAVTFPVAFLHVKIYRIIVNYNRLAESYWWNVCRLLDLWAMYVFYVWDRKKSSCENLLKINRLLHLTTLLVDGLLSQSNLGWLLKYFRNRKISCYWLKYLWY